MDELERKHYKDYKGTSKKYKTEPQRYKWNISMEDMLVIDKEIVSLVPPNARVLEVGCGDGRLAGRLMATSDSIKSYLGIDLVQESLDDAVKRNIRNTQFIRANYWDVLLEDSPDWDFVISEGVLFTCTNPKYKSLLMNLLDNTAEKGFFVLSVLSLKPKSEDLQKSFKNSVGITDCYLKGKRDRFLFEERLWNHPFWIVRSGIKNKQIPEIPKELLGLPEADIEIFFS